MIPLVFDRNRGYRGRNRYSKLELHNVAHAYGIVTKDRIMSDIYNDLLEASSKPKPRCVSQTDPVLFDDYEVNDDIVYILSLNDRIDEYMTTQCILRDSLIRTFESSSVYQWTVPRDSVCCGDPNYPVYRDPLLGIWYVGKSLEVLRRRNTSVFVAVAIGEHTIGSEFGFSRMHGSNEVLHILWKLPAAALRKWWNGTLTMVYLRSVVESSGIIRSSQNLLRRYGPIGYNEVIDLVGDEDVVDLVGDGSDSDEDVAPAGDEDVIDFGSDSEDVEPAGDEDVIDVGSDSDEVDVIYFGSDYDE